MDELPGERFSFVGVVEAVIEEGLVMLIQAGIGSPPMAPGGFAGQFSQNQPVPAYYYRVISDKPDTGLLFVKGLIMRRFQFDCFGAQAVDAQVLANAVDAVLHGFHGVLPDPDSTPVSSIIRTDRMGPEFSDSARNFWIMLEYQIWYKQP